MKSNLILVGLDYSFISNVAKQLADKLDMFFLDVNSLITYSIANSKVKDILGQEYFDKEQSKVAKSVKDYENTLSSFPYDLFIKEEINEQISTSALKIFIKLDSNMLKSLQKIDNNLTTVILTCKELSAEIEKKSDIVINVKKLDTNEIICDIINKLNA